MRLRICCRSTGPPPPGRAAPPFPEQEFGAPLPPWCASGGADPGVAAGAARLPLAAALPGAVGALPAGEPPAAAAFRRNAIRCATSGGNLRSCDWEETFTTTGFFVIKSITVIEFEAVSIELIVPAILRNDPVTISSASIALPSALRVPSART